MNTLPRHHDPIIALATAPGRGAVGIVRISGTALGALALALTGATLQPRHATLVPLRDAEGQTLDTALALYFPAPHSYTGEDVLELQTHGGPVVMQMVLERSLALGAERGLRVAEPGEFTLRAFLNGKLDLAQAEAVADLIDATTQTAARSATRSIEGAFSREVDALAAQLIDLRSLIEATLDFPEEEVDILTSHDVVGRVQAALTQVDQTLDRAKQGRLLRDGITVVLAGQPNVGKSSLLNQLAGADVAIVTPVAGTTRDRITQAIQIDGVPLHIVDTAGLRDAHDASDEVERIGMQRTWQAIDQADTIVLLHDLTAVGDAAHQARDAGLMQLFRQRGIDVEQRVIHVHNKADRILGGASSGAVLGHEASPGAMAAEPLRISALTGTGVAALRQTLLQRAGWQALPESTFIARARHVQALQAARTNLQLALDEATSEAPALELMAEALRLAHQALGSITGVFTADDLLGNIFGRFCIGK